MFIELLEESQSEKGAIFMKMKRRKSLLSSQGKKNLSQ
jgi:hypothetical protein